jgi:hypothetical protein
LEPPVDLRAAATDCRPAGRLPEYLPAVFAAGGFFPLGCPADWAPPADADLFAFAAPD